ncbi:MAG TPA: bifunctional YncE family protein/alkaline phosphatase family protein [Verrucomicrobiae bacterium]|jgi:YVTN family beta-propeller protein
MKRLIILNAWFLFFLAAPAALLAGPDDFDSTSDIVGWKTNGFETPVNQYITPAGLQVQLPGMRPNALALSPDGRLLVTSGLKASLLVLDAATGKVLQTVPMPSDLQIAKRSALSARILKPNLKDKLSYTGLAFSPDGRRLFLANVNGDVKVFSVAADDKVAPLLSFPLPPANAPGRVNDIPAGLAVSRDGKKLYVALNVGNRLAELDAATGELLRSWDAGVAPFGVALVGRKAYVSNWGGRRPDAQSLSGPIGRNGVARVDARSVASEGSVSIIDLDGQNNAPGVELLTGLHACGLAASPDGHFVACANAGSDTVSVIDTRTDRVVETVSARVDPGDLFGAQPDAAVFDQRGRRLFVCNASQNAVAVFDFNPGRSKMLGLIPVGWFPGSIAYDASRKRVDVANIIGVTRSEEPAGRRKGKGEGYNSKQWYGSLSLAPALSGRGLKKATAAVLANLRYPLLEAARLPARPGRAPQPVPERVGEPSPIQHVLYIVKENRTYDELLGDMPEGNGKPDLCVYGQRVTPNEHQFCRDFVLLDNTYCCGIMSAEGHQWTDSSLANDYIQRSYAGWPRSYPGGGTDPGSRDSLAYASSGFIWNDAVDHGKTFRDFGEYVTGHHVVKGTRKKSSWLEDYHNFINHSNNVVYTTEPDLPFMAPYYASNYLGFDLTVPDVWRASQFIQNLRESEQKGEWPNLALLWLPDDHTSGTGYGAPTPEAQVADNDLAFGQIVEAISHSRFWSNTCIFAIEDDPQDGWDHVSGYRTTAYVISPYTKRHAGVHTQYNQTSLVRTLELILGLPPMNQMDATATPMFDCFTNTPDFTPYDTVKNEVALDEMNPKPAAIKDPVLRRDAIVSARLPLQKEDQCPEDVFNRILWRAAKGSAIPYPVWAVKPDSDD